MNIYLIVLSGIIIGATIALIEKWIKNRKQKPECDKCIYFRDFGNKIGECRRNAPVIVERSDRVWPNTETKWPIVSDYEWCGEFKKK